MGLVFAFSSPFFPIMFSIIIIHFALQLEYLLLFFPPNEILGKDNVIGALSAYLLGTSLKTEQNEPNLAR